MHLGLQSDDLTSIGVGVIAVLVVLGFLISFVLTKVIARILILVVVAGLGFWVWQQRTAIEDKVKDKACGEYSFFGIHVDHPAEVKQACKP